MINRVEKEAMDAVAAICTSQFNNLRDELQACAADVNKLIKGGDVIIPQDMEENVDQAVRDLNAYCEAYSDRVATFKRNNAKLSADIEARRATGRKSASAAAEASRSATAATVDIRSSMK